MKANELRIGNYFHGDTQTPLNLQVATVGDIDELFHDPLDDYYQPIPLTEEWLVKLPKGLVYPDWIEFVHDLQNWYYYNNEKKELVFNL